MGSDLKSFADCLKPFLFQSTLPGWGATEGTRPTRRVLAISIHAPRMGSDRTRRKPCAAMANFNPRSPDGERLHGRVPFCQALAFQSTLPGWGATSTTAARTSPESFQSTLPGWGATCRRSPVAVCFTYFNPRSPDGERRLRDHCRTVYRNHFNPRSPDGERRPMPRNRPGTFKFQSTLPGWGATFIYCANIVYIKISIHAPRMGSDSLRRPVCRIHAKFQSTLPGWGATNTLPVG